MTNADRVERVLADWLKDEARARTPDYLSDILAQTERTPQRPAWSFPERWLPMTVISRQRVAVPPFRWRMIGVVALLLMLLVAALIAVGSGRHLPAPFGLAANGLVAYDDSGDIYVANAVTGQPRAIVTGPEQDIGPIWSRDGTHLVFERKLKDDPDLGQLYVVGADGSGQALITPTPLAIIRPDGTYEFSPDGRSVLIVARVAGRSSMLVAAADGSGVRPLDVGMHAYEASYRPPRGDEIVFVGGVPGNPGIYLVHADGTGLRPLVDPLLATDLAGPKWSPDGSRVAYSAWATNVPYWTVHTYLVDADGGHGRDLAARGPASWESSAVWSNSGTQLAVVRGYTLVGEGQPMFAAVIQADGGNGGSQTEVPVGSGGPCCVTQEWAPDDSRILTGFTDTAGSLVLDRQAVWEPVTGSLLPNTWRTTSNPSWQRLAP